MGWGRQITTVIGAEARKSVVFGAFEGRKSVEFRQIQGRKNVESGLIQGRKNVRMYKTALRRLSYGKTSHAKIDRVEEQNRKKASDSHGSQAGR